MLSFAMNDLKGELSSQGIIISRAEFSYGDVFLLTITEIRIAATVRIIAVMKSFCLFGISDAIYSFLKSRILKQGLIRGIHFKPGSKIMAPI